MKWENRSTIIAPLSFQPTWIKRFCVCYSLLRKKAEMLRVVHSIRLCISIRCGIFLGFISAQLIYVIWICIAWLNLFLPAERFIMHSTFVLCGPNTAFFAHSAFRWRNYLTNFGSLEAIHANHAYYTNILDARNSIEPIVITYRVLSLAHSLTHSHHFYTIIYKQTHWAHISHTLRCLHKNDILFWTCDDWYEIPAVAGIGFGVYLISHFIFFFPFGCQFYSFSSNLPLKSDFIAVAAAGFSCTIEMN